MEGTNSWGWGWRGTSVLKLLLANHAKNRESHLQRPWLINGLEGWLLAVCLDTEVSLGAEGFPGQPMTFCRQLCKEVGQWLHEWGVGPDTYRTLSPMTLYTWARTDMNTQLCSSETQVDSGIPQFISLWHVKETMGQERRGKGDSRLIQCLPMWKTWTRLLKNKPHKHWEAGIIYVCLIDDKI